MAAGARVLAVAQAPALGGAELALVRLARLLPERGFEIVATAPARGELASAYEAEGIQSAILPVGGLGRGHGAGAVAAWPRARSVVRRFAPDIVWLNGVVTMRLAPAFGRSAVLVPYLHDLLRATPRPWRIRDFWGRTPVVLCASAAVAQAAEAAGAPAERLEVVWAPVERPRPAVKPDWSNAGPVVGFVGRIEPRKGVLDLLEAFRLTQSHARLVVVGAAELGAPAEYVASIEKAAAELGDRVLMLGRVESAASLMPWFDVLAVPSLEEPFGTVAAEALAAGTPVVATRSGGIEEYLRPGIDGELVPPGNPAELARAIDVVLSRPKPDPGVANFAPERVADAVAAAFERALA